MSTDMRAAPHAPAGVPVAGRAYVLALLTLVYTFNHIDRQILVILLEPIKADLKLDDTQLGMLTGLAFALFYATLGIPIAMWADRGDRRTIISLALAIWSGMTALSGLAQNYWHLLLARMGVGVGEAGGTPPATSIISDLYPPKDRATALGVYTTGIGLGILAGFIIGGYVYELWGWRAAFFLAGVPGILLALLVRFTLKEPARGAIEARTDVGEAPPIWETLKFIGGQTSFLFLLAGCCLICISANAFLVFTSSHLQRTYGVGPADVSIPLGILIGGVGGVGAVVIGRLCDHLSKSNMSWRPWTIAICGALRPCPSPGCSCRPPRSGTLSLNIVQFHRPRLRLDCLHGVAGTCRAADAGLCLGVHAVLPDPDRHWRRADLCRLAERAFCGGG
ncbi:MAG: MFS transporter [Hyphomonas sp.]